MTTEDRSAPHPTILIIDDNDMTRKLVRMTLRNTRFLALEASNAAEALAIIASQPISLILQDLRLPDMDGLELLQRIRALPHARALPILAFSGLVSKINEARSMPEGFTDFVVKPIEPSKLLAVIESYLAGNGQSALPAAKPSVVVLDDNPVNLKLLTIMFERAGFEVRAATDGLEGLELCRQEPPDAVVSDILMPRLDGFQLCFSLRQTPTLAHIPVVLLSASYTSDADRALALQFGASDIMTRTLKPETLISRIRDLLRDSPPPALPAAAIALSPEYTQRLLHQLQEQTQRNATLSQQLAQRKAELAVLAGISQAITTDDDIEGVLNAMLQQCLDACGGSLGAIYLRDDDGSLRLSAQFGFFYGQQGGLADFFGNAALLEQVLTSGAILTLSADDPSHAHTAGVLDATSTDALMIIPILITQLPIGALVIGMGNIRADEEWLSFMELLGRQIGRMIYEVRVVTALRESDERFRQLGENIQEIFWMIDLAKEQLLYVSPAYETLLGRPLPKPGTPVNDILGIINAQDLDHLQADVAQAETKAAIWEYQVHLPAGPVRWLRSRVAPLRDTAGLAYGLVGVSEDITEWKEAELARHASEERYRSLVEMSPDAILLTDFQGTILFCNQPAAVLYNIPQSDALVGRFAQDILIADDQERIKTMMRRLRETGKPQTGQYMIGSGAARVPIEISSSLVLDQHGQSSSMLHMARDITERVEVEARRRAQVAAERANEAKNVFLSRMSHELRTPLNAILGFAQVMEMSDLPDHHREGVEYILKAGHHLLSLINEVLDISRIEAGALSLSLEPISIKEVVYQALDLIRIQAREHAISLEARFDKTDELYVLADRQRLFQVVLNLLSNAVKYNRTAGSVLLTVSKAAEVIRISIADTGYGIDPAHLADLFRPFERLGAERSATEGTGLGLALSKHLIEAMNGQIGVESALGSGSVFWIELPQVDGQLRQDGRLPGITATVLETRDKRTLLLVEDNVANARLIEHILGVDSPISLLATQQGRQALELVQQNQIDLVLLDLHLPDLSGIEVFQRLQSDPRTRAIPVVVLSADARPTQRAKLLAMGVREYLTKPLDVRAFLHILERFLV